MTPSFSLSGKVAIVTGASRGIGEAIARAFVAQGAKVVMASRKIGKEVAEALGPETHAFAAHTGNEADCVALVAQAIKIFGKVDVLVNNAGTNVHYGPLLEASEAAWDKTFEVNLKGYFWTAREVVRHLAGRNAPGSIVNIASVNGLRGVPLQGVYAMTKAAVISMTRTLAMELGPGGIRVNAIAPGLVDTRLASGIVKDEALSGEWMQRTPLRRVAAPDEIAGAAVYLASDASSYVTGEVLVVDGGSSAG
jgi:NAD(P)-dependent dehydrogenase (short-subunit alcohol dehydrogenase family)